MFGIKINADSAESLWVRDLTEVDGDDNPVKTFETKAQAEAWAVNVAQLSNFEVLPYGS